MCDVELNGAQCAGQKCCGRCTDRFVYSKTELQPALRLPCKSQHFVRTKSGPKLAFRGPARRSDNSLTASCLLFVCTIVTASNYTLSVSVSRTGNDGKSPAPTDTVIPWEMRRIVPKHCDTLAACCPILRRCINFRIHMLSSKI